jgi:uncharacterized protein
MAHLLLCPTCRRAVAWSEAFPDRPFCSARCRLIDLGAWLAERHTIPGVASETPEAPQAGAAESSEEA